MSEQGMRDPWNNGDGLNTWGRFRLDWLAVQHETLADLLEQIAETWCLTWCLFSKHPERFRGRLAEVVAGKFVPCAESHAGQSLADAWLLNGTPPPNVYVGTTVTTQAEADERIPELLAIPARVRVLRVSPREPLDLSDFMCPTHFPPGHPYHPVDKSEDPWCLRCGKDWPECGGIGWVVCEGGDTPMHPEWVRSLRDQAEEAGVPFWFSGWGEWAPGDTSDKSRYVEASPKNVIQWCGGVRAELMSPAGKAKAGRLLDGRTWDGVPS